MDISLRAGGVHEFVAPTYGPNIPNTACSWPSLRPSGAAGKGRAWICFKADSKGGTFRGAT
jgi:hypothetical protein